MGYEFMDYYNIGQRVRKYRKAYGLSQERLAEKVGISPTHMSHIETGSTKLSLPVLFSLSRALEVHTDDLLFSSANVNHSSLESEILEAVEDCSVQQLMILLDILKASKVTLNKYL